MARAKKPAKRAELTYEKLGADIGALVQAKQEAYGDAFGRTGAVMRELYPEGIPVEAMDEALTVVRVLDKLFRIAQLHKSDPMGETPWQDVAGYAILSVMRHTHPEQSEKLGTAARSVGMEGI